MIAIMTYQEFFESLGMEKPMIESVKDGQTINRREFPADKLDSSAEIQKLLQADIAAGREIGISFATKSAIFMENSTFARIAAAEIQPDIMILDNNNRYLSAWIVSGKLTADARKNITKRLEAATGGKPSTRRLLPLFGYSGVLLSIKIQDRTVANYDEELPLVLSNGEDDRQAQGNIPVEERQAGGSVGAWAWHEVKRRWREVLPAMGYQEAKKKANGEISYICPFCGHGKGGDGLTFIPNGGEATELKCFACKFSGSVIDLVSKDRNINALEALELAADSIGIDIHAQQAVKTASNQAQTAAGGQSAKHSATGDYTDYYRACVARLEDPAAVKYLNGRGISIKTARAAWIGYDPAADPANNPGGEGQSKYPEPRIIIPCNSASYIGRAIRPDIRPEWRKMNAKGAAAELFGVKKLQTHDIVFITEGWADALAIMEAGGAAVSLNSTSNTSKLIDWIQTNGTESTLVICLDNDKAGAGAVSFLERELKSAGVRYILADVCNGAKDPAEALQTNRNTFLLAVKEAITAAERERTKDALTDFLERIQGEAYKPHETGLKWFDRLLDGGLLPQTLTMLMAAPGAGKTALMQQLAEAQAEHGNAVIYINLEMSKEQMLSRAISLKSALTAKNKDECLTAVEVLQGYKWTKKQQKAAMKAIEDYRVHNFPHIQYIEEKTDVDGILKYLDNTGRAYQQEGKQAPAIILDYLHLVTGSKGAEVAETIKQTVAGLKDYAIKYNAIAVAISAINRNSYSRITLSSGRDSSGIEYTGDTILSLDYAAIDESEKGISNDEMAELQQAPLREMRLRILKSRHTAPGRKIDLLYDAAHNIFFDSEDWRPGYTADMELPTRQTYPFVTKII